MTYADRPRQLTAEDPACVVYKVTSAGATEFAVVNHRRLAALVARKRDDYAVTYESRLLQIGLDGPSPSALVALLAGTSGAALVHRSAADNPVAVVEAEWITHPFVTADVAERLNPEELPDLTTVIVSMTHPRLSREWPDDVRLRVIDEYAEWSGS